jgi:hypothetical protein
MDIVCNCLVQSERWVCFVPQVAHLNVPGSELYRKLRQLKSEKGGLTSQDERHFAQIRRSLEAEVLAHADVVSRQRGGVLVDEVELSKTTVRVRRLACVSVVLLANIDVLGLDLVLSQCCCGWQLILCIMC